MEMWIKDNIYKWKRRNLKYDENKMKNGYLNFLCLMPVYIHICIFVCLCMCVASKFVFSASNYVIHYCTSNIVFKWLISKKCSEVRVAYIISIFIKTCDYDFFSSKNFHGNLNLMWNLVLLSINSSFVSLQLKKKTCQKSNRFAKC